MMNEVAAGEGGEVVEIVVENGESVEFEQVLMYLEPVDEEPVGGGACSRRS